MTDTRTLSERQAEARRSEALAHAVQVAARQQVKNYDADIIVNVAQRFEAYLKGSAENVGGTP